MAETRLDPEDVRRYLERWKAFNEFEVAELRRTPADVKLRQLDSIRGLLPSEGRWRDLDEEENRATRERWVRLRKALGA